MAEVVTYTLVGTVATITMDDGKVNALSPLMLAELDSAFGQAEHDSAAVVLTGRSGILSAGFDLKVLRAGGADAIGMLRGGFALSERMLSFPTPVVVACPGHAMAMGFFVLLSADYRIGVGGAFKLVANEVAIGMTMPYSAIEIVRHRLTPSWFNRSVVLAEIFTPDNAIDAGILDQVVSAEELLQVAGSVAAGLAQLDATAHRETKLRVRRQTIEAIRAGVEIDFPLNPSGGSAATAANSG